MEIKKQQLEPDIEQRTGSKLRKEYVKAVYCYPGYLTCMQSTLCEMLDWMKHNLGSRLLREISITSDVQMTTPLWLKAKRNKRASWWRWKRRVKRLAWYSTFRKLRSWHPSHCFMTNRWGKNGNSSRFYFLGPKITADGDCSHDIKRCLLLGRKAMINLDNILKTRDITLPTKVHIAKVMVFQ